MIAKYPEKPAEKVTSCSWKFSTSNYPHLTIFSLHCPLMHTSHILQATSAPLGICHMGPLCTLAHLPGFLLTFLCSLSATPSTATLVLLYVGSYSNTFLYPEVATPTSTTFSLCHALDPHTLSQSPVPCSSHPHPSPACTMLYPTHPTTAT